MKNKFKFLALLLILPVMFVFTACGGQLDSDAKVDVGSDSKYTEESTIDDVGEKLMAAIPEFGAGFGVKLTLKLDVEDVATAKVNAIVKMNVGDDPVAPASTFEAAIKVDAEITELEAKVKGNVYYKDNNLYLDIDAKVGEESQTMKNKIDLDTYGDFLMGMAQGMASSYLPDEAAEVNPESLDLETIGQMLAQYGFEVTSYTEGEITRFKLSASLEGNDVDLYLVFNGDALIGAQANVASGENSEMSISLVLSIELFEGKIEYPSFDDYVEGFGSEEEE